MTVCARCESVIATETWDDEPTCDPCFEDLSRPIIDKTVAALSVRIFELRAQVRELTERVNWMESKLVNHIALGSGADTWSNDEV